MLTAYRPRSRVETVAAHLQQRGHISEGSALIEYGRFRLADAIHRLRNDRSDLIPKGKEIVTLHKQDTQGNPYGEYHLVSKSSQEVRSMVEEARAGALAQANRVANGDVDGVCPSPQA